MKKILSLLLIAVLAIGVFAGCSNEKSVEESKEEKQTEEKKSEEKQEAKLEGSVSVVGSTSVTPVAQNLADAFSVLESGVQIDVQGVGSTAGVKATDDGSADIGMASRNLKSEEKEWGLTEHVIAYDGITVVVHPSNKVEDLTGEQVTKIFKGEIKNWKEVGGEDKEILVISRESGSGTRGAFEEIMHLQEKNAEGKKVSAVIKEALIAEGNGAVKANVASKEYSIGYISLSYLDESVKGLKVDGVEPTIENIKAEKYSVFRPFLMLTKGEPSPAAKAYLDFILSDEGQKIVGEKLITVK
ncbi:phosphate ABC transporter substrate-binding protein [Wukongibacter sp. M2B1]|uniref:phosphate ABC transporter substrate-binding protein n=1 Tax=Wukongibacter sp. M2B1 TaxID=3088895 RepID=UPI003D7A10A9